MPRRKILRIIIDTNLFISYLIGRRLHGLKKMVTSSLIVLVFAEQNLTELEIVSDREKFTKYFKKTDVLDLVDFIRLIGEVHEIDEIIGICRDPKDDFLLSLAKKSKADYLITGDNDLLNLKRYGITEIISIDHFEELINGYNPKEP